MTDSDYIELVGKPDDEPDQAMLLWGEGSDLRYAWYGMNVADVLRVLKNTIADIEGGQSEPVEGRSTKR